MQLFYYSDSEDSIDELMYIKCLEQLWHEVSVCFLKF